MVDITNPAAEVKFKLHESSVATWIHPMYAQRVMEYNASAVGGIGYCPMLGRNANGLRWKLDKDLHMVPGSVEVF